MPEPKDRKDSDTVANLETLNLKQGVEGEWNNEGNKVEGSEICLDANGKVVYEKVWGEGYSYEKQKVRDASGKVVQELGQDLNPEGEAKKHFNHDYTYREDGKLVKKESGWQKSETSWKGEVNYQYDTLENGTEVTFGHGVDLERNFANEESAAKHHEWLDVSEKDENGDRLKGRDFYDGRKHGKENKWEELQSVKENHPVIEQIHQNWEEIREGKE